MKRIFASVALIAIMMTFCFGTISADAVTYKLGDVDNDNNVTPIDATIVQRVATGILVSVDVEFVKKAGDVDGNGTADVVDATFIQRHATQLNVPHPIGQLIEETEPTEELTEEPTEKPTEPLVVVPVDPTEAPTQKKDPYELPPV